MDGDTTISMTINAKGIKSVEEQHLHSDLIQEEGRESRYSQFHRRARPRGELNESAVTDSSAIGDVPHNRDTREKMFLFTRRFFYYLFQVK